ncbi:hypothetical protein ADUPG1_000641 [Aduncisulcus paluster]|uniref:Uncharacterized protein n=1 Tax=Aduncisulcus paluster TaxID=2918883 RepID=A0ABQ5KC09_9EUKA|nr:hypothetical protein ADUPG1_000641 [Aduncisulcus paluster]
MKRRTYSTEIGKEKDKPSETEKYRIIRSNHSLEDLKDTCDELARCYRDKIWQSWKEKKKKLEKDYYSLVKLTLSLSDTISDFMDGEEPKATLQELSTARLDSLIADFAKYNKVTSNLNLEFSLKEPTFDLSSFPKSHPADGSEEEQEEIKSVNDLSKLELEIGRTFSIDLKSTKPGTRR